MGSKTILFFFCQNLQQSYSQIVFFSPNLPLALLSFFFTLHDGTEIFNRSLETWADGSETKTCFDFAMYFFNFLNQLNEIVKSICIHFKTYSIQLHTVNDECFEELYKMNAL